jgi:hypothetical protein
MMRREEAIKLFGLNNILVETDLRRVEKEQGVDLGHTPQEAPGGEEKFYPQFPERLRKEANAMAEHYALFYCLESSIRELIVARLADEHGLGWWDLAVPEPVKTNAEKNRRNEIKSGVTLRSDSMIDYTNFGELGEIIKANFDLFGDMLRDVSAIQRILASLNTLRAPIAHCKLLAEDEVVRLHLGLRDWFRQMS